MNPAVKVIILAVIFTGVKGTDSTCSRCHREAVLFQAYSGRSLCREHLVRDIERRARREVRRQGGLRPCDRVAVLPGGRAADVALRAFLERHAVGGRLAVHPLRSTSGESVAVEAAREGCTVFADASVLEDAATRILAAVLRGRAVDLLAPPPPGAARVIRPFVRVPAEEVRLYARWMGGTSFTSSRSEMTSFDCFVSEELERHAGLHPSAPFALARLEDALLDLAGGEEG
ncbi:hypothetical protein DSECCO2_235880 [anaerobic digester metagenome]